MRLRDFNASLKSKQVQFSANTAAAGVVGRRLPVSGKAAEVVVPPASNTGALFTKGVAVLDWLSFTLPLPDGISPTAAAHRLAADMQIDAATMQRGMMGYSDGLRLPEGGAILWNPGRLDMGLHVVLPSKCLALLDSSPHQLCKFVFENAGKIARLDVAIDTDEVHISQIDAAVRCGDLVSRSQSRSFVGDYSGNGYTIYIGRRGGRRFVRFYDKAAEQKLDDGSTWTRCEVELRAEHAATAATHIVSGGSMADLIFSSVDFRDASTDENISRRERLSWWSAWVGDCQRVSFAILRSALETIEQVYEWVNRQVGPSLAFLDAAFGGGHPGWLIQILDSHQHRIPSHRRSMLENFA